MDELTKTQKVQAIKLANMINCDAVDLSEVLSYFQQEKTIAEKIVYYWHKHNKDTKRALDTLLIHKARMLFEICYTKEAEGYPEIEN